jgi:hypothetical protein
MKVLKLSLACTLAALALIAAGCTKAQAKIVPELPPLDVPAPPPRNVEAAEVQPPSPPPPPEEPVPAVPTRTRPSTTTQQQRPEPAKQEPPRVEVPPPAEPKPAEESKATPQLQTQPPGREVQLEQKIKEMLGRAGTNLNRLNYGALTADARTQYDQAKRFISQAQDALNKKNLVFAENLADKANTLAAQLSGR